MSPFFAQDKSIQSAGAAGVWRADAVKTPYVPHLKYPHLPTRAYLKLLMSSFMNIFISTWVLLVSGLVLVLPMIFIRVTDTTNISDDL